MPSDSQQLSKFASAFVSTAPRTSLGRLDLLAATANEVHETLGEGPDVVLSSDAIEQSVTRLLARQPLRPRDVRTCATVASTRLTIGGDSVRLIDDRGSIAHLVEEAERCNPRYFGKFALALTHAYLAPAEQPVGDAAKLLAETIPRLAGRAARPTDSTTRLLRLAPMFERRDLRTFYPYINDARSETITPVRAIGAPSSSWLWTAIIDGGLREAGSRESDGTFRALVPGRLAILREHPEQERLGVGLLLNRIASGRERTDVEPLRERALEVLGNPMQSRADAEWDRWASPESRKLLVSWLTRQIVRLFFGTLNGARADPNRSAFWERYADSIDELWLYASEETRLLRPEAVANVKRILGDNVRQSAETSINTFGMRIGGHVVVEFSEKGNAAYFYDRSRLPHGFTAAKPKAHFFKDQLIQVDRLVHSGGWEFNAQTIIRSLENVDPGR